MVIFAGHIAGDPQQRESYLAGCVGLVEQARRAAGYLDVAISGDLIDPGRIKSRWSSARARDRSPTPVRTWRSNWSNRGPPRRG
jgi:hypothetical protein